MWPNIGRDCPLRLCMRSTPGTNVHSRRQDTTWYLLAARLRPLQERGLQRSRERRSYPPAQLDLCTVGSRGAGSGTGAQFLHAAEERRRKAATPMHGGHIPSLGEREHSRALMSVLYRLPLKERVPVREVMSMNVEQEDSMSTHTGTCVRCVSNTALKGGGTQRDLQHARVDSFDTFQNDERYGGDGGSVERPLSRTI